MAKFVATVELQNASPNDYTELTAAMEKVFFKEEKNAGNSKAYVSNKGVFSCEGKISLQDVNQAISKAASTIGKKYSFHVLKSKQLATAE
jgi:hypothetical protein